MIKRDEGGRRKSFVSASEIKDRGARCYEGLTADEKALLHQLLREQYVDEERYRRELDDLYGYLYQTRPVSMEQFLDDPYYLGESCEALFPELRRDLIAVFSAPYREALFTGALGVGKTTASSIILIRLIYEMSCMINPQRTFGLSSGSEILLPLISKNLTLAREVMKTAVDDKIKESPYFMKEFPPKFAREFTLFPKNIRVVVGSYGSERILGGNVAGSCLDETNFPPRRKAQQISVGFGQRMTAAHFDIVEKVYRGLLRRIKSRFEKAGGDFPGMVVLASSAATLDSFTERKMREAANDPDVFVRDHVPWSAKPREDFSGDWFYILCSASSLKARILKEDEYDLITDDFLDENDAWIIEVPEEYREDFEANMEDSLRDIAGVSTQAVSAYIQRVNAIDECVDATREHPFTQEEWVAGGPGSFDWEALCVSYERKVGDVVETAYKPRRSAAKLRWCHVDTSLSGDSSGLCVGHVDRWVEVVRRDEKGNRHTDLAPYYVIDIMLRINPPPAEQIYMPDVRRLIYELMEHGFQFAGFSSDSYQAAEMHQQIRRRGLHTEILSLDRDVAPYDELKSALYENRIELYEYEPFREELKKLEYDRLRGKVDHPPSATKDVADSVAGTIYALSKSAQRLPLEAGPATTRRTRYEHDWVSGLIPADQVDLDDVRALREEAKREDGEVEFMPILFGDSDDFDEW